MTYFLESHGFCPVCCQTVIFRSKNEWLRDYFVCTNCFSLPRERALVHILSKYFPGFRNLTLHESSPSKRALNEKFRNECENYSSSQFYPDLSLGANHPTQSHQCQDLENLTFKDESFDLFITQDVVEHILNPSRAFKEIARVLRPGGAHVFSVPLVRREAKSSVRASRGENGEIVYHHKAEYHGKPINEEGSLVTMDWGYDITEYIMIASGMHSTIAMIDMIHMGIRAEYNEIIVSRKY